MGEFGVYDTCLSRNDDENDKDEDNDEEFADPNRRRYIAVADCAESNDDEPVGVKVGPLGTVHHFDRLQVMQRTCTT